MDERIEKLTLMASQLRRDVVNAVYYAKDGHPGPCMSAADLMAVLYFDLLRLNPEDPSWIDRDRFILSKGHACPLWYAALARRGYFPPVELKTLRVLGSRLQGHPDLKKTPGVDANSGSLGHGLSQACGLAIAARKRGSDSLNVVITGDGELNEGIVWEAAMAIAHLKLTNVIAIVDNNGMQSGGKVEKVSGLYPLREKWEAFGWYVVEEDGHDISRLLPVLERAFQRGRATREERQGMSMLPDHLRRGRASAGVPHPDQPVVLIAHTLKGKGVPYMEGDNSWHKRVPTDEEHQLALSILGGEDLE
ncbi:MAG TPA: transketolase [Bacteroidales bacterium]|nr:transketolase [Bacteroidales bacterium]